MNYWRVDYLDGGTFRSVSLQAYDLNVLHFELQHVNVQSWMVVKITRIQGLPT